MMDGSDTASESGEPAEAGKTRGQVVPQWLRDYEFTLNEDDLTIYLNSYAGADLEVTVYGTVTIGDKEYQVYLGNECPWGENVSKLTCAEGIRFGQVKSYSYFSNMDLEELDLGGADFSSYEPNTGANFLDLRNNDSLKTIVLPVGVEAGIQISGLYVDEDGNYYSNMRIRPDHVFTITKAESISDWLKNYAFTGSGNRIVLSEHLEKYTSVLTVPGNAEIDGEAINEVVVTTDSLKYGLSDVQEIIFEQGVILAENSSGLFSNKENLNHVDMSNLDVSEATDMSSMFTGCSSLQKIETPKNCTLDVELTGSFVDENGNVYTSLPKNLSESITLTKSTENHSEWLDHFDYSIDGDKLVLTGGFYGAEITWYGPGYGESSVKDFTIPGSAVVNGVTYNNIQISPGTNWGCENLSFEQGVTVPDDCSLLFHCSNHDKCALKSIDFANIDASNVTNMRGMFNDCYFLGEIENLGVFDTSQVTDISYLFYNCSSLSELDISTWDLSKVESAEKTFSHRINVIQAPLKVSANIKLPGKYMGSDGNTYTSLPLNLDESITLTYVEGQSESGDPTESGDPIDPYDPTESGNPSTSGDPCEHVFGEWVVIKDATCTEDGSRERECTICGEKETETLPALGHDMIHTEAKDATCTEDGNIEYWKCSRCGGTFSDEAGTTPVSEEDIVIEALGHDLVHTEAKDATCTETGNIEYWTCSRCGEMFSDEAGTTPVEEKDAVIAAKGHSYGDWVVTKEATRTEAGSREKVCSVCGDKITEVIPRISGTWRKDSKGWWYQWSDGSYPKSTFETIDGKTYYFNASGYMVTGWQAVDGKWYYFNGSGAQLTGWQQIGGKWYYLSPWDKGAMVTGWQKLDGKWYYFNSSGAMVTGWRKLGGTWYYFTASGALQ